MKILNIILKFLFHLLIVRPAVLFLLGMNIRNRKRLPHSGPAIIISNHNSHLDTVVLMSICNLSMLNNIKAVAAADYFLRNRFLAWFATEIVGIIPIDRKGSSEDSIDNKLSSVYESLENGGVVILFPEGSRGTPEEMTSLKSGVARISEKFPTIPVIPVFIHGLGKVLPKGETILVPFHCDVIVGEPMNWCGEKVNFMTNIRKFFDDSDKKIYRPEWT